MTEIEKFLDRFRQKGLDDYKSQQAGHKDKAREMNSKIGRASSIEELHSILEELGGEEGATEAWNSIATGNFGLDDQLRELNGLLETMEDAAGYAVEQGMSGEEAARMVRMNPYSRTFNIRGTAQQLMPEHFEKLMFQEGGKQEDESVSEREPHPQERLEGEPEFPPSDTPGYDFWKPPEFQPDVDPNWREALRANKTQNYNVEDERIDAEYEERERERNRTVVDRDAHLMEENQLANPTLVAEPEPAPQVQEDDFHMVGDNRPQQENPQERRQWQRDNPWEDPFGQHTKSMWFNNVKKNTLVEAAMVAGEVVEALEEVKEPKKVLDAVREIADSAKPSMK